MRWLTTINRSLRLRCPSCGEGKLFRGWFSMHAECSRCGLRFQREPGYFLGSIYFNYALTALVVVVSYFGLFFGAGIQPKHLLWPEAAFCVLFPLWFFRYARSLWLGFDHLFDPPASTHMPQRGDDLRPGGRPAGDDSGQQPHGP